ncbi:hypothetical protein [Granulicella sp. dw_53]|uniref:hypothetical protein n=1 Tax=Granulicella sp. dw_53 TaxID=2719792 RepID=UPI001BD2440A|nr:hypothetical protein [Granulicella sp. dw_53]
MKGTNVKITKLIAKLMSVGLLAGAFVVAAPTTAQAQVAVGVQIGSPHYDYVRQGYYNHARFEEERREIARQEAFERRRAFEEHLAWQRAHDLRFHGRDDRFRGDDFGRR